MPASHPVLGYPSKSAAAAALRDEGLSWAEIGARIGVPVTTAAALAKSYERRAPRLRIALTAEAARRLEEAAGMRGLSLETLATRLLADIAAHNLVDAVLDDLNAGGRAS